MDSIVSSDFFLEESKSEMEIDPDNILPSTSATPPHPYMTRTAARRPSEPTSSSSSVGPIKKLATAIGMGRFFEVDVVAIMMKSAEKPPTAPTSSVSRKKYSLVSAINKSNS